MKGFLFNDSYLMLKKGIYRNRLEAFAWCTTMVPFDHEEGPGMWIQKLKQKHGNKSDLGKLSRGFLMFVEFLPWALEDVKWSNLTINTVDGSEIPNNHLRCIKPCNNGISTTNLNWCVSAGIFFRPSTVLLNHGSPKESLKGHLCRQFSAQNKTWHILGILPYSRTAPLSWSWDFTCFPPQKVLTFSPGGCHEKIPWGLTFIYNSRNDPKREQQLWRSYSSVFCFFEKKLLQSRPKNKSKDQLFQ